MADEEPAGPRVRHWRIPYEWILGTVFVATFYFGPRYWDLFLSRTGWLLIALPLACVGFGLARAPAEPKPRSGWLLGTAAFGWLYLGAMFSATDAKHSIGETAREFVMAFFLCTWPVPPALCLACLIAVAWRPLAYREFATFSVAATLLAYAWLLDLMLSGRHCGMEPPKPSPVREAAALVLTLAPLAWAVWLMVSTRPRGSSRTRT